MTRWLVAIARMLTDPTVAHPCPRCDWDLRLRKYQESYSWFCQTCNWHLKISKPRSEEQAT